MYGGKAALFPSVPVKPVDAVIDVDFHVLGCPIDKDEFLHTLTALLIGKKPPIPPYPVCVECRTKENVCAFDRGETCLGAVTRAGCGALCPTYGSRCYGCRGRRTTPTSPHSRRCSKSGARRPNKSRPTTPSTTATAKAPPADGRHLMAKKTLDVNVDYVSRVEGHGNIVVEADGEQVKNVRFEVTEPPRFFEAMLRGRPFEEAPLITSRICGICSNGHVLASISALENALGVTPSDQTTLLRQLLLHGETIQSHVLHAYFLVAPDFFGVDSAIRLVETMPEVVKRALRLKKLGNDMCETIGGRAVTKWPPSSAVSASCRRPTNCAISIAGSTEPWPTWTRRSSSSPAWRCPISSAKPSTSRSRPRAGTPSSAI